MELKKFVTDAKLWIGVIIGAAAVAAVYTFAVG
jgi:hypothetical protein